MHDTRRGVIKEVKSIFVVWDWSEENYIGWGGKFGWGSRVAAQAAIRQHAHEDDVQDFEIIELF